MSRFDCVIFDLDGTLLYSLPDIAAALNRALESCGCPPRTMDEVRAFVGSGVRRLVLRAVPGGESHPAFEAVLAAYGRDYALHCRDATAPYPGIVELLDALRARGLSTGVMTNKTHADAENMVRHYFGDRITRTEGKREGRDVKPDPQGLLDTMAALNAAPERTLYIGDTGVDAETAQNAGTACLLALWGYRSEAELAPCHALGRIRTPGEALEYL